MFFVTHFKDRFVVAGNRQSEIIEDVVFLLGNAYLLPLYSFPRETLKNLCNRFLSRNECFSLILKRQALLLSMYFLSIPLLCEFYMKAKRARI